MLRQLSKSKKLRRGNDHRRDAEKAEIEKPRSIIAGIALEVGIGPTVRHALDLNLFPVLVRDACGSKTADLKEQTMTALEETGEVFAASSTEVLSAMKPR